MEHVYIHVLYIQTLKVAILHTILILIIVVFPQLTTMSYTPDTYTTMLHIDLRNTFDRVDHSIFLVKLEASGLDNDIRFW